MRRASKFTVSPSWSLLISDMGIDVQTVLAFSGLPKKMFALEKVTLSAPQYFDLWRGLEKAAGRQLLPLLLADHLSVEVFDPPVFAAICSPNLNSALLRIQQYKPLVGPVELTVDISGQETRLMVECYGYQSGLPSVFELSELVFFTQLSRLATRQFIRPCKVVVSLMPDAKECYEDYFGCEIVTGSRAEIWFSERDARYPFMTANSPMWDYFEGGLKHNLAQLGQTNSVLERVKSVLIELLPSGKSSIEEVASALAMSKRTLQRRLREGSLNYNKVLQSVRLELADYYLVRSTLSLCEISFLLGFQETNSFTRAFSHWRGVSPGSYREKSVV